ncbi:polysaccharide deacetylase family protein [Spiribacter halobius]|nr:polysaccharide deacetylase family protein [Spiribacter halobius]UEX77330.1 polysaccharide deacetylase family protein [Spiribacter halobius]
MYHAVERMRGTPRWRWSVSLERFRQHLDLLQEAGYRTLRVADLDGSVDQCGPCVLITFDDGYADNYAAFQELSRRGMVGTWFVVTRAIGGHADWLEDQGERRALLTAEQLREMAAAGMEVGAHGRRHLRLAALPPEELRSEVRGSREDLENLLSRPVTSFAYPYGSHDDAAVAAVSEAGYTAACTVRPGWIRPDGRQPLALPRLEIGPGVGSGELARMLTLGTSDGSWLALGRYFGRRLTARFTGR